MEKPSKDQIEQYINAARSGLGQKSTEDWAEAINRHLYEWGHGYSTEHLPTGGVVMVTSAGWGSGGSHGITAPRCPKCNEPIVNGTAAHKNNCPWKDTQFGGGGA